MRESTFRRHNMTSTDVIFWRLKLIPGLWGLTVSYLIEIFTHLKLCLTPDAIHNFKWVKIILILQNGGQLFQILLIDLTFYR